MKNYNNFDLETHVNQIKHSLEKEGLSSLAIKLAEAVAAGATGTEIHFRVRGALLDMKNNKNISPSTLSLIKETVAVVNRKIKV